MLLQTKFILSAPSSNYWPNTTLPEVLIMGKSNVGKSTFINSLVGLDIARASSTPGRTEYLNFFQVNDSYILVDSPGFGYSNKSKGEKRQYLSMVDEYLNNRQQLRVIILLVNSKYDLNQSEISLIENISNTNFKFILVATKSDQLNQSSRAKHKNLIRKIINSDDKINYFLVNKNDKTTLYNIRKRLEILLQLS